MGTVDLEIETAVGSITVSLDGDRAPVTVANFLHYVDSGMFDGGRFHRTVRLDNQSNQNLKVESADAGIAPESGGAMPNDSIAIEVIQGGINLAFKDAQRGGIALERTRDTGLRHLDGTISMARRSADSAVSDFFICINDQPDLDFGGQRNVDGQGFAAFGQVTHGMDVVRAIQGAPSAGQSIEPPIRIERIRRSLPKNAKS